MRHSLFLLVCVLVIPPIFAPTLVATADSHKIIIDNRVDEQRGTSSTADVFAFRSSPNKIFGYYSKDSIGFPKHLVVEAALQFKPIRDTFNAKGLLRETVSFAEMKSVIDNSGYTNLLMSETLSQKWKPGITKVVAYTLPTYSEKVGTPIFFDAASVTNMLATGVIDIATSRRVTIENIKGQIEHFDLALIRESYQSTMKGKYQQLRFLKYYKLDALVQEMKGIQKGVLQHAALKKSLYLRLGQVTFGEIFPETAEEKGLELPRRISNNFDVYWVVFAVTFRDLPLENLEEVSFHVALPPGHIALQMAPLRYGITLATTEEISSPDVTVKAGRVEISVGEFYKKTVSYSLLKPTIAGYGLRENTFSWTLQDEAMLLGSHEFVAVLGVPKGTTKMVAALSIIIKSKPSMFIEGGVGSSLPKLQAVKF